LVIGVVDTEEAMEADGVEATEAIEVDGMEVDMVSIF
jgi:hypothetical protein